MENSAFYFPEMGDFSLLEFIFKLVFPLCIFFVFKPFPRFVFLLFYFFSFLFFLFNLFSRFVILFFCFAFLPPGATFLAF